MNSASSTLEAKAESVEGGEKGGEEGAAIEITAYREQGKQIK